MMKLAFKPAVASGEDEIPIAARAAVVSPMWDRRIVAEDRVQSDFSLVVVTEIFRPIVNLFLAGRVPWHFTAKGIRLCAPAVRALSFSVRDRRLCPSSLHAEGR